MPRPSLASLTLVVALAALVAGTAARAQADRPKPTNEVALTGHGGVTFKVPAWKETRKEAELAVFEQVTAAEVSLLVVSIEKGPGQGEAVDWELVRKNIVEAAGETGGKLALTVGEAFEGAPGFQGRRMSGQLETGEAKLGVALVALVRDGRFVSVSVLTLPEDRDGAELAGDVGATVKLTQ